MVVTSREAGFRNIRGVIASVCKEANLAPFDEADVRRLCERWHVEVVGNSARIRAEAHELANAIWHDTRIRVLVENPLMLTTLLVVRRCSGGDLPTQSAELYREAVRVLIRTWNTSGFPPMNLEEALPLLSFVACSMLLEGIQQVGQRRLVQLLRNAKSELDAELHFSPIRPEEFIERIESRSSLLMQTGDETIETESQPVFEFRHLSFQEFLAVRGFVEEQYPGRNDHQSLTHILEPHFEDEHSREVISLVAVLAGRKSEPLIKRLTDICGQRQRKTAAPSPGDVNDPRVALLRQCLYNEVMVSPRSILEALRQMARHGGEQHLKGSVVNLRRGKFGDLFREVAEDAYLKQEEGWEQYRPCLKDLAVERFSPDKSPQFNDKLVQTLLQSLKSEDRAETVYAAELTGLLAEQSFVDADLLRVYVTSWIQPLCDLLCDLLSPEDPPVAFAAAGALAWIEGGRLSSTPADCRVPVSLVRLWRYAHSTDLRRAAALAFAAQPLRPRATPVCDESEDYDAWLLDEVARQPEAACVLGWYLQSPWTDCAAPRAAGESYVAPGLSSNQVGPRRRAWVEHQRHSRLSALRGPLVW